MRRAVRLAVACVAVLGATAGQGQAGLISLNASDSGWYQQNGYHESTNTNYLVGTDNSITYRNFLLFDLSSITGPIISATLRLENPQGLAGGILSTYSLFDINTPISTLTASQSGATGVAVYNDLGTGPGYGSILVDGSFSPGIAEISLNSNALSALNLAAGNYFAIGGSLSAEGSGSTYAFGFSGNYYVRQLVLETSASSVPEPASVALFGIGACVAGISAARRRREKQLETKR